MRLKQHYDKLLHVTITFMLLMFATKWLSVWLSVGIVFTLQTVKVFRNKIIDKKYTCTGDLVANGIGYWVWIFWVIL